MNELDRLRGAVCDANRALRTHALVALTWGNVSGISADRRHIAIKPSGVPYEDVRPQDIVIVDPDGNRVDGALRPSTDTPTHLALYQAWPWIAGVAHTHSPYATMFAQARRGIPCLGTTHADVFAGGLPLTRQLTEAEIAAGYERATGAVILECFTQHDPRAVPGVLVAGHAPFTWADSPARALENAVALEAIAQMAFGSLVLGPAVPLEQPLLDKHQQRKHGADAYYGQPPGKP